jgi:hypothetical protein
MSNAFVTEKDGVWPWRGYFNEHLEKLKDLPPGADSWSPHRPPADVLETAYRIAQMITRQEMPLPIIAAGSDGSVQVKWRNAKRELSFFIEPDRDHTVEYLLIEPDNIREGELPDLSKVPEFVDWLFK